MQYVRTARIDVNLLFVWCFNEIYCSVHLVYYWWRFVLKAT